MKTNVLDFLDQGGLTHSPASTWVRDNGLSWTFAQFHAHTQRIGSDLIRQGAGMGNVVAVFMPNGAPMLAADFGILRAGAAFLNIDIGLPKPRIQAILESVDPKFIVAPPELLPELPEAFRSRAFDLSALMAAPVDDTALAQRRQSVIDTDPACLITTSGSTGVPKAVALSHRGLIDFGDWFDARFDFNADDVVGSLSPLFFDGYIPGLLMSLWHGGQFVILPKEAATFPATLAQRLAEEGITFIFWVPSTLVPLAKLQLLDQQPLPRLRFVGFAGEVIPPSTLSYLRRQLPHARFVNFYGPIEISVICTSFEVPHDFPEDAPVPIGQACANSRILLLNEADGLCAPGEVGELCVAGSCVALGYWNNPDKTAKAFARNPLVKAYHETIYRTGDLARVEADGNITFLGRRDFQIKHQGYRIDLAEIEHAADVTLEAKACSVLYDHEGRRIVLFYEAAQELSAQDIRTRLSKLLPKYMLPTLIHRLERMPLNPNGKIDRKLLGTHLQAA